MMTKKIMIIALIVCSLCALNFNVSAAASGRRARKAGGFDRDRPNNFTSSMKKLGGYLLWYIPNRVVDATDIITLNASVGGGFQTEVQATRFAQMGGSYGQSFFMAKAYSRQFGCGHKTTSRFGLVNLEKEVTFVDETTGTVKEYVIDFPEFISADYHLDAFRDKDVDFWKIGGSFGWVVGVGFGIHPLEIADFITGIFWLDISNDDF